jgi:signal transduction histidine kinase
MLPKRLITGFDKGRLRNFISLFFLALAVPTAVLIWQAYSQLKWEAYYQHRAVAEELTGRIDTRLNTMIRTADARSFADYTFLVVTGDPSANFVQRSPLSAYPVAEDLPGVLGYFQVDTDGVFSTPILPPDGTDAASLGIAGDEYASRIRLAEEIQAVLAENRLVQSRPGDDSLRRLETRGALASAALEEEKDAAGVAGRLQRARRPATEPEEAADLGRKYSQQVFDDRGERQNVIGKVSDLKLDADLQEKVAELEDEGAREQVDDITFAASPERAKRKEQIALPESARLDGNLSASNVAVLGDLRISTFESEIDPFELKLLDSGHIVLFRKVWRDGERYIQGMLLDQEAFIQDVVGASFRETLLSTMSNLIVAYEDDVIHTFSGRGDAGYSSRYAAVDGTLLYRNRLTAPLNSLELIFSINHLPPGAGANVLGWVTFILAVVFVGGFLFLYRLGLSQINLARQQQDFVSAVSHELKTPLTSIRMYGEMLREGWADEDKRQSYYEFIHDESERLSKLIANVLQLAKITRNDPQFDLKPVNVGELMSNVQVKISDQVERAGFALHVESDDNARQATINMDEGCFVQIVINLVDNAIKFSRDAENKVIDVSARLTGDKHIEFSVRDYGPGIRRGQMKKIFQLFYRSESELTRETVGTGIGLAIVHQLTLAMHGGVDLVNAEPGAEFRVRFPVVPAM